MTFNSFTENEEHDIPSQILKTIFGLRASVIFKPQHVISNTFVGSWDPRPQWSISRTSCLYYSTRVDLYSDQILLSGIDLLPTYDITNETKMLNWHWKFIATQTNKCHAW